MNASLITKQPLKAKWNLPEPPKQRLRDAFADWMRVKNYRDKTITAYVADVLDFVLFHGKRDPKEMRAVEVQQFLTMLAGTHTFRHSFATHLLESGVAIYDLKDLLGHSRIETTMIYNHVASPVERRIKSPLDR